MNEPSSALNAPEFSTREAADLANRIRSQVARSLLGQREVVDQVLIALLSGGHVLVEGVPGLGKTLLVLALARSFGGRFSRVQFTPDLMPSDVTGHVLYDMRAGEFRVRRGPAFTHLLLADEINRAPAKTQAALLEVMQEHQITIEGESYPLDAPFMTLATQNPIEQEGTYPLPEAQLDRFLLKVLIDYPTEGEELSIVRAVTGGRVGDRLDVAAVETVAGPADIGALQRRVAAVTADDRVLEYAVRLVRATRAGRGITIGAGPRGAIAMVRAARAAALLDGRDFLLPDDIKAVALPALRHRVRVSPELELEGLDADAALSTLITRVEAPRA